MLFRSRDFGYWEDDVEFMGYWKTSNIVQGQNDRLKASVYARKGRGKALLVVGNLSDNPVSPELIFDPAKLGLKGNIALTNAETGKPLTETGRGKTKLPLTIPGRNYVLVSVTGDTIN